MSEFDKLWAQAQTSTTFDDLWDQAQSSTAVRRARTKADDIERMRSLLDRKDLTDAQRKKIERLVRQWENENEPKTFEGKWAAGAKGLGTELPQLLMGGADLALSAIDVPNRMLGNEDNLAGRGRDLIREGKVGLSELTGTDNTMGQIGDFAGQLAMPFIGAAAGAGPKAAALLNPYGRIATGVGEVIQKVAPQSDINAIIHGINKAIPVIWY